MGRIPTGKPRGRPKKEKIIETPIDDPVVVHNLEQDAEAERLRLAKENKVLQFKEKMRLAKEKKKHAQTKGEKKQTERDDVRSKNRRVADDSTTHEYDGECRGWFRDLWDE